MSRLFCWLGFHDRERLPGYYFFPKDGNPRIGMFQRVCIDCGRFEIAPDPSLYSVWAPVEAWEGKRRESEKRLARARKLAGAK